MPELCRSRVFKWDNRETRVGKKIKKKRAIYMKKEKNQEAILSFFGRLLLTPHPLKVREIGLSGTEKMASFHHT